MAFLEIFILSGNSLVFLPLKAFDERPWNAREAGIAMKSLETLVHYSEIGHKRKKKKLIKVRKNK